MGSHQKVWSLAWEEAGDMSAWTIRETELSDDGELVHDSGPMWTNAQIDEGDEEKALAWASTDLSVVGDWQPHRNAGSGLVEFWTHQQ